jgi:hypothetical protein
MILTRWVSDKKQELPSLRDHMSSLPSFWWCLCCLSFYFSVMSFLLGFFMFVFALGFVPNVVCNCELSIPDFFKDVMLNSTFQQYFSHIIHGGQY